MVSFKQCDALVPCICAGCMQLTSRMYRILEVFRVKSSPLIPWVVKSCSRQPLAGLASDMARPSQLCLHEQELGVQAEWMELAGFDFRMVSSKAQTT